MASEEANSWISEYLACHGEYASAAALEGGVSNYLYRLTKKDGSTVILKHAEAYAASDAAWTIDIGRISSEHDALRSIQVLLNSSSLARRAAVEFPRVISYDDRKHNLIMSDCGTDTKDLHTAFPSLTPAQRNDYGRRLGLWLAALHQCNNSSIDTVPFAIDAATPHDRKGLDQRIELLSSPLRDAAEKRAFIERLDSFVVAATTAASTGCLMHGDFWPGNILVGPPPRRQVLTDKEERQDLMAVIDWEGVRLGTGASDVGAFAAEAWLLCHFHSVSARASVVEPEDLGMFNAFLASYLEVASARADAQGFVKDVLVYFALNLSVGRGGKELMLPVKRLGIEIVQMIMEQVVGWELKLQRLGWGMEAWRDWVDSR